MSMWAEYLKERTGRRVVEYDQGFIVFYVEHPSVIIEDIYVNPDLRQKGYARKMADELTGEAKRWGCTNLMSQVVPTTNGATEALKVQLAYGMRLVRAHENAIILRKEI